MNPLTADTSLKPSLNLVRKYFLLVTALSCLLTGQGEAASYAVARSAAPVLNTPAFSTVFGGTDGKTLKTDRCGQVRELEFIALPGTAFRLLDEIGHNGTTVYRVETDEYPAPAGTGLYLDSRFMEIRNAKPVNRKLELPPRDKILSSMKDAIGSPYVWGGNLRQGVAELATMFYHAPVGSRQLLAGVDCSGLLYEATSGWTPRNTSQLVSFGTGMPIAGKTAEALIRELKPLDLIVWKGHVIIVMDGGTVIESRLECGSKGSGGVVATPLRQRMAEIMRLRRPADSWPTDGRQRDVFVVRRWMEGPRE